MTSRVSLPRLAAGQFYIWSNFASHLIILPRSSSESYQYSESDFPCLPKPGHSSRMMIMANKKTILVEAKKEEIESEPIISSSKTPPNKKLKEDPKERKIQKKKKKAAKTMKAKAVNGILSFFFFFKCLSNFLCRTTFGGLHWWLYLD